jgi:hypothetical protein
VFASFPKKYSQKKEMAALPDFLNPNKELFNPFRLVDKDKSQDVANMAQDDAKHDFESTYTDFGKKDIGTPLPPQVARSEENVVNETFGKSFKDNFVGKDSPDVPDLFIGPNRIPYAYRSIPYDESESKDIFEKLIKADELYFVIDAQSVSIKKKIIDAKQKLPARKNVTYILNKETVNDPAGKPNEDIKSIPGGISYDSKDINNPLTMSYPSFKIQPGLIELNSIKNNFYSNYDLTLQSIKKTGFLNKRTVVRLTFYKGTNAVKVLENAKQDNAKPTIKKQLASLFKKFGAAIRGENLVDFQIKLQQKRSGDWLQALSTLQPERFEKLKGTKIILITLDRVCLCYALNMGANVLFTTTKDEGDKKGVKYLTYFESVSERPTFESYRADFVNKYKDNLGKIKEKLDLIQTIYNERFGIIKRACDGILDILKADLPNEPDGRKRTYNNSQIDSEFKKIVILFYLYCILKAEKPTVPKIPSVLNENMNEDTYMKDKYIIDSAIDYLNLFNINFNTGTDAAKLEINNKYDTFFKVTGGTINYKDNETFVNLTKQLKTFNGSVKKTSESLDKDNLFFSIFLTHFSDAEGAVLKGKFAAALDILKEKVALDRHKTNFQEFISDIIKFCEIKSQEIRLDVSDVTNSVKQIKSIIIENQEDFTSDYHGASGEDSEEDKKVPENPRELTAPTTPLLNYYQAVNNDAAQGIIDVENHIYPRNEVRNMNGGGGLEMISEIKKYASLTKTYFGHSYTLVGVNSYIELYEMADKEYIEDYFDYSYEVRFAQAYVLLLDIVKKIYKEVYDSATEDKDLLRQSSSLNYFFLILHLFLYEILPNISSESQIEIKESVYKAFGSENTESYLGYDDIALGRTQDAVPTDPALNRKILDSLSKTSIFQTILKRFETELPKLPVLEQSKEACQTIVGEVVSALNAATQYSDIEVFLKEIGIPTAAAAVAAEPTAAAVEPTVDPATLEAAQSYFTYLMQAMSPIQQEQFLKKTVPKSSRFTTRRVLPLSRPIRVQGGSRKTKKQRSLKVNKTRKQRSKKTLC